MERFVKFVPFLPRFDYKFIEENLDIFADFILENLNDIVFLNQFSHQH